MLQENIIPSKKCVCISCFNHYETRMCHVLNFFKNKGYQTTYITSDYSHFEKKYFIVKYSDTYQVHVPVYTRNMSVARIRSQLVFSWKVYKLLKSQSPDVIFCQFPPNSLITFLTYYKRKKCCKLVFDGYDMWPESLPVNSLIKLIFKPIFGLWAKMRDSYIEQSDLVLAVSSSMTNGVKDKWKNVQVKLFLPGVITTHIPNYSFKVEKGISFCYLGNINHITDIELLVNVLCEVHKMKPVTLHIIGGGQYLDNLKLRLIENGIECVCHGVVMSFEAKKDIYSLCNMAINVPKEIIQSTMSLKSVEYMGVGLPFINSAGGDTWEIVENKKVGVNIQKDNICDTALRIVSLSELELIEMHENCIEYSKKRFEAQDLNDIFKEVL